MITDELERNREQWRRRAEVLRSLAQSCRQIDGWDSMTPTEAAQSVQRSALPDAYGQWESLADDLLVTQADVEALD